MSQPIRIGITESETRFQYYIDWLQAADESVEIIVLSHHRSNIEDFERCDGIVLSGGIDSHPRFYNNPRLDYPLAQEFQEARDEWEIYVFQKAREANKPVLAICRGMQIVNIALGGTLIQDLEESGRNNHRRLSDLDRIHPIQISRESLLYGLAGSNSCLINSAHHQGLDRIAPALKITAIAEDLTPEAVEYDDPAIPHYLLAVQWHPERVHLGAADHQLSLRIRASFLQEARNYRLTTYTNMV
jgi:putative glutamine amidotransferase